MLPLFPWLHFYLYIFQQLFPHFPLFYCYYYQFLFPLPPTMASSPKTLKNEMNCVWKMLRGGSLKPALANSSHLSPYLPRKVTALLDVDSLQLTSQQSCAFQEMAWLTTQEQNLLLWGCAFPGTCIWCSTFLNAWLSLATLCPIPGYRSSGFPASEPGKSWKIQRFCEHEQE